MTPARRLFIGAIVLISAAAGYAGGRGIFRPSARVVQPIAFNHKVHAGDAGIECATCHLHFAKGSHSGLPSLDICLECHQEALTQSAEEEKIRQLASEGRKDVFLKLFRVADHVFYSHRRHVTIAGLTCETCHGPIATSTAPPDRPELRITMEFCMDCHRASGVPSDCTRCHR